ncbi:NfeD family protein [Oceanicaulis sp.]|uniref:NfeD family protein n=1 Tax=Oceanicaulis sp. TaxID=1924941 RepID=UPI003BAD8115
MMRRPARFRLRALALTLILLGALVWVADSTARQAEMDQARVMSAEIIGPIGPATSAYIQRAITLAGQVTAQALIVEMDTPGGLDTAMRDINRAILSSQTPVIVFVHPSGARATSAGVYILYASHLAGMAPGTSLGAATPVQLGGMPGGEQAPAPEGTDPALESAAEGSGEETGVTPQNATGNAQALRNKAVNDAVAYIRSLAELRGRNADWAERAVRDGVSATADEALSLGVIEIRANNLSDLLSQADGQSVFLGSGEERVLNVAEAQITRIEKTVAEDILSVITDPNIAFLLVNLGFVGLLVSFYNGLEPVTAIAGVICLIVGFYALNTLPVNFAGAALVVLGLALLVSEAFFASSGLLALGGLVAFVLGGLMLIETDAPAFRIDWRLIAVMAVVLGGTLFAMLSYGLAAQARKVTTGGKSLIGAQGHVLEWSGQSGFVQVQGERWKAVAKTTLSPGDTIVVTKLVGLTLNVKASG